MNVGIRDSNLRVDTIEDVNTILKNIWDSNKLPWDNSYLVVHPSKWRLLVIGAYQTGSLSWGQAFCQLYNGGWRGKEANPADGF